MYYVCVYTHTHTPKTTHAVRLPADDEHNNYSKHVEEFIKIK